MPEWLFATLFVGIAALVVGTIAWRNTAREIARTAARRANPTKEEFMAMMTPDVSEQTALFLWDRAVGGLPSSLTPHPEDNLAESMAIDEEEWSIDWPADYARLNGFHESNLAEWPDGWKPTLRNLGKWLDMSLVI